MSMIRICVKYFIKVKNRWKKQLHTWHWISSAVALICMILFAITGITLNHASALEAKPEIVNIQLTLPDYLHKDLISQAHTQILPEQLKKWLKQQDIDDEDLLSGDGEWSEYDVYLQKPYPGGDMWLSIDFESGELEFNDTDRGLIAWLNDLHKGRNTHPVWIWFLDLFSVATLVFCITGLLLLQIHSKRRPSTWYITAAGIVVPGLLILFYF